LIKGFNLNLKKRRGKKGLIKSGEKDSKHKVGKPLLRRVFSAFSFHLIKGLCPLNPIGANSPEPPARYGLILENEQEPK
jgi:hypothetical protein